MTKGRRLGLALAGVLGAAAGTLVISSYRVNGDALPGPLIFAVFGLAIPTLVASMLWSLFHIGSTSSGRNVWAIRWAQNREIWRRFRRRLPLWLQLMLTAIIVIAMVVLNGNWAVPAPEAHGRTYFYRGFHGLVSLTRSEYEHRLASYYRGFAAFAMLLCALAIIFIFISDPGRGELADGR